MTGRQFDGIRPQMIGGLAVLSVLAVTWKSPAPVMAQSREVDVGRSLYELKMKVNAQCAEARKLDKRMRAIWTKYRAGRATRREYDYAYALFHSKRRICLQGKQVYTALKNQRMFNRNDVDVRDGKPPVPAPGGGSGSVSGTRPGGDPNDLRLLDKTVPGPVGGGGGRVRHHPASSKIHNPRNSQWIKPVL